MAAAPASGEAPHIHNAVRAVEMLVQQRMLLGKAKDEMALVLLGTADTQNELAKAIPGGYEHIVVRQGLDIPSLEFLRSIAGISAGGSQGDALDAAVVALEMLKERIGKKNGIKRVMLITDGASPLMWTDQMDDIVSEFKGNGVLLELV